MIGITYYEIHRLMDYSSVQNSIMNIFDKYSFKMKSNSRAFTAFFRAMKANFPGDYYLQSNFFINNFVDKVAPSILEKIIKEIQIYNLEELVINLTENKNNINVYQLLNNLTELKLDIDINKVVTCLIKSKQNDLKNPDNLKKIREILHKNGSDTNQIDKLIIDTEKNVKISKLK
jgi:hypothetical protein